ncbi:MAG: phage portal protein [Thermoguttaceae bacterium]|nr:phage portal protein [Thermoguttaceae bacterium]MDW8079176.1 phage portal protein [Thermoguttaceae bacterium]
MTPHDAPSPAKPTGDDSENALGTPPPAPEPDAQLARLWQSYRQAIARMLETLHDQFPDCEDPYVDSDGQRWLPLDSPAPPGSQRGLPYRTEAELAHIRLQCRALAVENEFAINGHENRISYIVGTGHGYRVTPKPGRHVPESLLWQIQEILSRFLRRNMWHRRQQEIVRRRDRDGEVFLRFLPDPEGTLLVRFIEPEQVYTPEAYRHDPAASFGILTRLHDVESVLGYFVDGEFVPASHIQHRKANVDFNVKRGLPLFYPVRKNLRRAEKLLRNMCAVAEIQSAIALIRRHTHLAWPAVEDFLKRQPQSTQCPYPGPANLLRRFAPGTILDVYAGTEYEFPAAGIDAARFVAILQAELRAIASRLVMPEFMLTSDASNANYASTMVAEGPAVKMFQRLQQELIEEDLHVMWRVLETAASLGQIPSPVLRDIDVQAIPPSLAVRDRLKEAQADWILVRAGAMSPQTMAMRHGLDPDRERQLRTAASEAPWPPSPQPPTHAVEQTNGRAN